MERAGSFIILAEIKPEQALPGQGTQAKSSKIPAWHHSKSPS